MYMGHRGLCRRVPRQEKVGAKRQHPDDLPWNSPSAWCCLSMHSSHFVPVLHNNVRQYTQSMTETISYKLDVFQNRCLRRILNIVWPNTVSDTELHRRTATRPVTQDVKKRRRRWVGHVLRMSSTAQPRVALRWTVPLWPQEDKLTRGDPEENCREGNGRTGMDLGIPWCGGDRPRWRRYHFLEKPTLS